MYKVEPAVADGGEVIIYAPHIREVSFTHGGLIEEVGYHCRDYFLAQPRIVQLFGRCRSHRFVAMEIEHPTESLPVGGEIVV
jgi:hypothetical protein